MAAANPNPPVDIKEIGDFVMNNHTQLLAAAAAATAAAVASASAVAANRTRNGLIESTPSVRDMHVLSHTHSLHSLADHVT